MSQDQHQSAVKLLDELEGMRTLMALKINVDPTEDGSAVVYTVEHGHMRATFAVPMGVAEQVTQAFVEGTRKARQAAKGALVTDVSNVLRSGLDLTGKEG